MCLRGGIDEDSRLFGNSREIDLHDKSSKYDYPSMLVILLLSG